MNAVASVSIYDELGGEAAIQRLVQRFYALMDELPEAYAVRQMHPESLLGSAKSLFEFLSGWFGGPSLYIAKNGHPRLRMRHANYAVGLSVRDEWMLCMKQALTEQVPDADLHNKLVLTFDHMADHLMNTEARSGCPV